MSIRRTEIVDYVVALIQISTSMHLKALHLTAVGHTKTAKEMNEIEYFTLLSVPYIPVPIFCPIQIQTVKSKSACGNTVKKNINPHKQDNFVHQKSRPNRSTIRLSDQSYTPKYGISRENCCRDGVSCNLVTNSDRG
ncbi:hypothetical protein LOTGIDRAFT_165796 [Lottia gigantea]|uniref:Uncharacterized protein n=1 Tax=Lottia gigantea TaxID=225164 RepID=V4BIC3_LOTGI|nr:hypothetical protein LOTGIDRAFT_165796 [Lottia gigantea]ESO88354.1 hypothetical protein LOTGIDRAFT_165796 [Lottia gigantea]